MRMKKRYKLIANPFARRGDAARAISKTAEALNARGVSFDLELTAGPREAGLIAKTACEEYDVVVAVGGGTYSSEYIAFTLPLSELPKTAKP